MSQKAQWMSSQGQSSWTSYEGEGLTLFLAGGQGKGGFIILPGREKEILLAFGSQSNMFWGDLGVGKEVLGNNSQPSLKLKAGQPNSTP